MPWVAADLAENSRFIARVKQAIVLAATQVQAEDPATPNHAKRGALAQQVLYDADTWAPRFAIAAAQNPQIVAGTPDCPESDIEFVINSLWGAFALVTT